MPAIGMFDAQVLRHMIKFEDRSRGCDYRVHAAPFEIGVAERMADGAERSALHKRQRFEQVESPEVVPDRLHRAALVAERIEIGLIIGEQRIGRREADVTASREFDAVLVVRALAEADDYFLSERMSLVQAKDA